MIHLQFYKCDFKGCDKDLYSTSHDNSVTNKEIFFRKEAAYHECAYCFLCHSNLCNFHALCNDHECSSGFRECVNCCVPYKEERLIKCCDDNYCKKCNMIHLRKKHRKKYLEIMKNYNSNVKNSLFDYMDIIEKHKTNMSDSVYKSILDELQSLYNYSSSSS